MKVIKKTPVIIVCIVALVASSFVFTGCSKESASKKQSVSLVLGTHRYFPQPNLSSESIYKEVYRACETYGNVSAVIVDGEPFVACNYEIKKPDADIDSQRQQQLADSNTKQIIAKITSVSAQTPEIDTLSAITKSANSLHSASNAQNKSMVIIDSGLSTAALLNFAEQNIIETPTEEVVDQIKDLKAIPDLSGIEVKWVGLGDTCGEQTNLTQKYRYQLKELWKAILEEGGARSIDFDLTPSTGNSPSEELPECTTVPVVEDSIKTNPQKTVNDIPEIIKWDDNSTVRFKADKAEFTSPNAAGKEMEPVAKYLKANPNKCIYILGMTATVPGGDNGISLSTKRAELCKNLLVKRGVSEKQLLCKGLGHNKNSLRVKDVDKKGNLIEVMAKKNRAVFFVKEESNLIKQIV